MPLPPRPLAGAPAPAPSDHCYGSTLFPLDGNFTDSALWVRLCCVQGNRHISAHPALLGSGAGVTLLANTIQLARETVLEYTAALYAPVDLPQPIPPKASPTINCALHDEPLCRAGAAAAGAAAAADTPASSPASAAPAARIGILAAGLAAAAALAAC